MPSSRARCANRTLRSPGNTAIKSEASVLEGEEEDGEGEDEDEFVEMMNQQGFQAGSQAIGSAGGRKGDSPGRLSRPFKSRVQGGSSQKRKEQNRIAQRAFRKCQKAYFIDLEKEMIEKTGSIQAITRSNQSLMEMMERLQRKNIALKAVKAPTFAGVPYSPTKTASDEIPMAITTAVGCPSLGDGNVLVTGWSLGRHAEEGDLVSINDLAGRARALSPANSSSPSLSASKSTIVSPIAMAPPSSKDHDKPVNRQSKKKVPDNAARRKLSSRDGGSISEMSSVLATLTSPGHTSSDNVNTFPEPRRRRATAGDGVRITEVINYPIWGMDEYLPPIIPNPATPTSYSNGGCDPALHLVESPLTSPPFDYNSVSDLVDFAQMQQQHLQRQHHLQPQQSCYQAPPSQADPRYWKVQQGQKDAPILPKTQQDQDKARSARRYSEALQRHHAGPLMSRLTATSASSFNEAERPETSESKPQPSRNEFAYHEMVLWNDGVFNGRRGNGQGYLPATRPSRASCSASPRAETFADMVSGLKHESNGTMMPFTGVLTPIDGFGSLTNTFGPSLLGAQAGQQSGLCGDLDDFYPLAFALENANNTSSTFAESPATLPFES